jgi:HAD superfamily hydrolase (TIGR01544 family)
MDEKLKRICADGKDNIQLVFDFDNTMNETLVNGIFVRSMIAILEHGDYLPGYKEEVEKLNEKYYPFHNRKDLPEEFVRQMAYEWMDKTVELLKSFKLTKDILQKVAENQLMQLRKGVADILHFANLHNIPVIIFSANILGNEGIEMVLERFDLNSSNVQIVSNELVFNENGFFAGYTAEHIYPENKTWSTLKERISPRKNTILFGDGHGDSHMVEEENGGEVFRVAVLDNVPHAKIEDYRKVFDCITSNVEHFSLSDLVIILQNRLGAKNTLPFQK